MLIQLDRHDATGLDRARSIVRDLESVVVAYSGGVGSTLLLRLALTMAPLAMSRTNTSSTPFVSPETRFVANE